MEGLGLSLEGAGRYLERLVATYDLLWPLLVAVGLCICSMVSVATVYEKVWGESRRIRAVLEQQGVRGPKPSSFLFGNVPDIQRIIQSQLSSSQPDKVNQQTHILLHNKWVHKIFPYFQQWRQLYGSIFMYSTGTKQHLYVGNPQLIKELNLHRSLDLGKPSYLSKPLKPMLGNGIIRANGPSWAYQKNLIAPEFFIDKVKSMAGLMEECTVEMIKRWESRLLESETGVVDMSIDKDLKTLTAEVISKAIFGGSYAKGNQIFEKLATMQAALYKPSLIFGFMSLRFLPTKENQKIWKLQKEVDALILEVIRDRQMGSDQSHKDLLQMLLGSAYISKNDDKVMSNKHDQPEMMERFIVDKCKNIYFAGYETSALSASWTLMLLAMYPEWQERVRAEIVDIYGTDQMQHHSFFQDIDAFRKMKTLMMVIQESMRLYGPALTLGREALDDIKLGELVLPKGIIIWVFTPALHRDPDIWGLDANEFKPQRFANGISEACKNPQAYLPFGYGNRLCVGQAFAMLQLKIVLSLLIFNFSFSISLQYCHSPVYRMLLVPEYGMQLLVQRRSI